MGIQDRYMHKATFLTTSTLFSAVFGAYTPGRYDFTLTPSCANVNVFSLLPGSVYWISRFSVGGNIPEEDYLGSIIMFPQLIIKNALNQESLYRYPLTIDKYIDAGTADAWFQNDRLGNTLQLTLTGQCQMLPSMIGVTTLSLRISIIMHQFNDAQFAAEFRRGICPL